MKLLGDKRRAERQKLLLENFKIETSWKNVQYESLKMTRGKIQRFNEIGAIPRKVNGIQEKCYTFTTHRIFPPKMLFIISIKYPPQPNFFL